LVSKEFLMTFRLARPLLLAGALACSMAACAHTPEPQAASGAPYKGVLTVVRTYVNGRPQRTQSEIEVTVASVTGGVVVQQRAALDGKASLSELDAVLAHDGSLSGLRAHDDRGGDTAVRYARDGSVATLVEKLPNGAQTNRIAWPDGSYRSVQKLVLRSATVISRMRCDAHGRGSWNIRVYPRSNSSSTYYGFLNDAEMQYDYAVQVNQGVAQLLANGGYAKGYDDPPRMHEIASEPAWFSSTGLYRRSGRTTTGADPMAGTAEVIRTDQYGLASNAPERVVVDDTLTRHFVSAFSRSDRAIASIVIDETVTVPVGAQGRVSPAFSEIVREQVRRLMRIELAEALNPLVVVRRPK
jgi:hypothetical protein